jgi:hypothetical protein
LLGCTKLKNIRGSHWCQEPLELKEAQ